tara:strand:- start:6762 stop:7115 length:354 start_codon:yes stop_codon:yes gene_type:complete
MDHQEKKESAAVIDLVKYKIEKYIKFLPPGSTERKINEKILELYEDGKVTVYWSDEDLWVAMTDGSPVSPELLGLPETGDDEVEIIYRDLSYDDFPEIEFTPDFGSSDDGDDEPIDE